MILTLLYTLVPLMLLNRLIPKFVTGQKNREFQKFKPEIKSVNLEKTGQNKMAERKSVLETLLLTLVFQ